jgi:hypothetical protein
VESHRDYIASLEKPAHEVVGRRVVQEVYPHSAAEHPDVLNEVRKVNWKSVAVGIAASVVIALTLSPDVGRNIWHFIISIFK